MTRSEQFDAILLRRIIEWQYRIDGYTDAALVEIQKSLRQSLKELTAFVEQNWSMSGALTRERALRMIDDLRSLSDPIAQRTGDDIATATTEVGTSSITQYQNILSFDGRITNFNTTLLSPEQLKSFVTDTPIGGKLLEQWVNDSFDYTLRQQIKSEILTGAFKGESYGKLLKRFQEGFKDLTDREIITLTRTYVQSANVNAMKEVHRANPDLVKKEKWVSKLESGYMQSGRGVCPRCMALDGTEYPVDEHPPCPLHPRCACIILAVPPKVSDIPGLENWKEIEETYRPATYRPDKNIDEGLRRQIIGDPMFVKGDYADWFKKQSNQFKINAVGPRRAEWLKANPGKSLHDLVDPKTGRLYTLDELMGKGPKGGGFTPSPKAPKVQKTINKVPEKILPKKSFIPANDFTTAKRYSLDKLDIGYWDKTENVEIANYVNEGLTIIKEKGYRIPGNVSIDSSPFKAKHGEMYIDAQGGFDIYSDTLYINPDCRFWKDPATAQKNTFEIGHHTTDNKFHFVFHECGHVNHYYLDKDEFKRLAQKKRLNPKILQRLSDENVGGYGWNNPVEMIAEMFAGMLDGKQYSNNLMFYYKKFNGPEIK